MINKQINKKGDLELDQIGKIIIVLILLIILIIIITSIIKGKMDNNLESLSNGLKSLF